MDNIIEEISAGPYSSEQLIQAYTTILKILTNIRNNTENEKYRVIKKSNATVRKKLLLDDDVNNCFPRLILAIGFIEDDEVYRYDKTETETLDNNVQLITGIVTSIQTVIAPDKVPSYPISSNQNNEVSSISSRFNQIGLLTPLNSYNNETLQSATSNARSNILSSPENNNVNASGRISPVNKKPNDTKTFRRRDDDVYKKAEDDVTQMRMEQARKFKENTDARNSTSYLGFYEPTSSESVTGSTSSSSSRSSGFSGFISNIFGSSRNSSNNNSQNNNSSNGVRRRSNREGPGLRMKTLKDIQPPPSREGRGG